MIKIFKNKNNKNVRNNNKKQKYINQYQQIRDGTISLSAQQITRKITVIVPIYANSTSGNYTFSAGSDVRFYSIGSAINGATEFSNLQGAFKMVKCSQLGLTVFPVTNQLSTSALTPLFFDVDPGGATSNPTNAEIITSDATSVLMYGSVQPLSKLYTFNGKSTLMNTWISSQTGLVASWPGAVYIGSTQASLVNSLVYFLMKMDFTTQWCEPY
jgi:hypothetical protein